MSSIVSVERVLREDKHSQKCIIPLYLFERSSLELGKYAVVKVSEIDYVCRLNVTSDLLTCIFLDDFVVRSTDITDFVDFPRSKTVSFADCVTPIEVHNVDCVKVKVLISDNTVLRLQKNACEDVVRKIISRLVVGKNYFINCRDVELAKMFNIGGVFISEISPSTFEYGKIVKTTNVELIDVTTWKLSQQVDTYRQLESGGLDEAKSLLKLCLILSYKSHGVLVSGPSGSGKTLLAQEVCCKLDGYFVEIDKLQSSFLDIEKCNLVCDQFASYLQLFPDRTCVLIIDGVDDIVSCDSKQNLSIVSLLVKLLKEIKVLGVYILATAVQKNYIHHAVSSFFSKDVSLGIPSLQQRKDILQTLTKNIPCDINYDKIARMTPGFVGYDISSLIKEAKTDAGFLNMNDVEKALENISPLVLKTSLWNVKVRPVYWEDIGGLFQVKKRLQMCIEWPLQHPEIFKKVGLPCPHGVLLFGPPGCCKTTLARGLATECNANFFAANPAQIYSPYVGESEKNLVELFYQARLCSPSMVFLDELDSLVSQRQLDKKGLGVGEKVLSTLLNEMDGFGTRIQFQSSMNMKKLLNDYENLEISESSADPSKESSVRDVIVVAATNRPDLIDDALLRPGRFDIILYVPPPDTEERKSILETLVKGVPINNVNLQHIAEQTDLFSGADLKNLCNEASLNALRHDMSASFVTGENFNEALKKVTPSITRPQVEKYENLSSKYGTFLRKF